MTAPGAAALPRDAVLAACLLAVDPAGLGGVIVRGGPSPTRDAFLALLRKLSARAPLRRMPPQIGPERLVGGLDLARTLKAGRPVIERGVLAAADGGALLLPMAERLDPQAAALIASALASRSVTIDVHGQTETIPARFAVVALDESRDGDDPPPAALTDRMALAIDLDREGEGEPDPRLARRATARRIAAARDLLTEVEADGAFIEALCAAAVALGARSLRAGALALAAARAHAAFEGRDAVEEADVVAACRLVLARRATRIPAPPEDETQPPEPPAPPERDDADRGEEPPEDDLGQRPLDDVLTEAALAALPPDVLAALASPQALRSRTGGKSGARLKGARRGRPAGSRRGALKPGARLDLVATLRAAAPWQPLRRQTVQPQGERRIAVHADDHRIVRYRQRTGSTTLFAVDASGSQALHRLAEAKGAVELLLADCYVRRDEVALIAFRGQGAEVLLAPTRSLTRAKRSLEALPGGGATPLAAGILAAGALAEAERRRGRKPAIVLITDGRGNIALSGEQGRAQAETDALAAARRIRAEGHAVILIDTSPRASEAAGRLAGEMGARYLALPHADAGRLSRAVGALAGGAA
jgi:magnesium chelatase subunit D